MNTPTPIHRHTPSGRPGPLFVPCLLVLILILFFSDPAFSKTAAPEPADAHKNTREVIWPHDDSDLTPSPDLTFGTLANGLRYVLMQNNRPEDRVSMHLNISVGSYHEKPEERGIAHFLEHMLFSGSEHFEPGELVKYFQRIGMKFGPDVNARTGFFDTTYDLDLPAGDQKSLEEGFLVLRDYAAGGLIPENEVIDERSIILAEKRTRDSASYRTFEATLEFEMPQARLSERLPIGTVPVIKTTDRALLKSFYDKWYRPEKMTLTVVGDFDPREAQKLIASRFSDITACASELPAPDFGEISHQGIVPFYHHEVEAGSTRVAIEVIRKEAVPPDSKTYQHTQILSDMADRIITHRLNKILNKPDAPFTSADIGAGRYLHYVRAAEISADCAPEEWKKSLSVLEQNLRKALSFGFTKSEVARVQKEFSAALEQAVQAAPTRESNELAGQIINALNQKRVFQSPWQRQALLEPVVASATPERLHQLFKENWAPEHRLVLVTGNADLTKNNDSPEQTIRSVYEESRKTAVKKPVEADALEFPYLSPPQTPGGIKSREVLEDLGITRVVFENGTSLLVKKTDFKTDQVLATLSFGTGESAEPKELPGLSELSQQVVNLSGLGKLDRDELSQVLAGKNTGVSFAVEEDKFVFSGMTITKETRLLFELLYARIMDPAFRESAYNMAIRQFTQEYQSLTHSVEGALQLEGKRFLAGGDTRFGLPPLEALKETKLENIRQWIGSAITSAPLEIAVVGDIDTEQVIELAAIFFGTLPDRSVSKEPESKRNPDFPETKSLGLKVPTRIQKGLLLVSYPTTAIWDIHDTRRLSILSEVFSDRMRIEIREKLGASYSQSAYNNPSRAYPDYGLFTSFVVIDPEDAGTVETAIRQIAKDLSQNGASEDELQRALNPVLTGIKQSLKTNGYWLNTVMKGASRHPVQFEWSRTIQDDYASITLDDINRIATNYLKNPEAATLVIYPETIK